MPVNKVVFGAVAIMDISDSTVTKETLGKGVTAYDKTGEKITGEMEAGVSLPTLSNEGAAGDLLTGKQLIDGDGNVVEGAMPNNGAVNKTLDGIEVKSVAVPAGYTSGGTVALDGTIDGIADDQAGLIAQIQTALEGKAAGSGSATVKTASGTAQVEAIEVDGTTYYGIKVTGLDFTPCAVQVGYGTNLYNVNRFSIMSDADGNIVHAAGYGFSTQSACDTFAARCSVGDGFFSMPMYTTSGSAGADRPWVAVGI